MVVPPVVTQQFDTAVKEGIRLLGSVRALCWDYERLEKTVAVLAGPDGTHDYDERREWLADDTGLDVLDDALCAMAARLLKSIGGWPADHYATLTPEELAKRWDVGSEREAQTEAEDDEEVNVVKHRIIAATDEVLQRLRGVGALLSGLPCTVAAYAEGADQS